MKQIIILCLVAVASVAAYRRGHRMFINHAPFWGGDSREDMGTSYRYHYPYISKVGLEMANLYHQWYYPPEQVIPSMPPMPPMPSQSMAEREWPDWIPPIRMIKLPLDVPPVD